MAAKIVSRNDMEIKIEVTISIKSSMLDFENAIQDGLNEAGRCAMAEALSRFDTDGTPLMIGGKKWTTKGLVQQTYKTPYGEAAVSRHIYQSSKGGRTYCPLEQNARIVLTATPRLAKNLSSKYSRLGVTDVRKDLIETNRCQFSKAFIQDVCNAVGAVAVAKEESWEYELPELPKPVSTVSIGLDGTCMLIAKDGYRQAMVGTIGFHDREGERQHTIYAAASPEYGKATFYERFTREIKRVKKKFPGMKTVGLADGAKDNWEFLKKHVDIQTLDFWHLAGYVTDAAKVLFKGKRNASAKEEWIETSLHNLKHKKDYNVTLYNEIADYLVDNALSSSEMETLQTVLTYFENNMDRMGYSSNVLEHVPIGSGATEAACKSIVKQRMCGSGMRWKDRGATMVLSLRCLNQTDCRWDQFWARIDREGFPVAA